jgi:putative Holliday junction resolvase
MDVFLSESSTPAASRDVASVETRVSSHAQLPAHGCLLGIDAGDRRVGVAASDVMQLLATPLLVMQRGSRQEDFQRLARIAAERKAVGLVVGHPLNADGSEGPQGRKVGRYAWRLASALQLPLVLWDEFGSTQAAQERLAYTGRRRAKRPLDAEAAAIILQDYLDQQHSQHFLADGEADFRANL